MKIVDALLIQKNVSGRAPQNRTISTGTSNEITANLLPGQLIKARVLGLTAEGKLLLDIDGQTFAAKSEMEIKPGQEIWLEVKQNQGTLVLAPAGRKAAVFEVLRVLFSGSSQISETFDKLSSLQNLSALIDAAQVSEFAALLPGPENDGQPDIGKLISLIRLFGGSASQSPADQVPINRGEAWRSLLNVLLPSAAQTPGTQKTADLLAALHGLNVQPLSQDQNPFFVFPCLFSGISGWGEWVMSWDEESGGQESAEEKMYSLDFFLEMSRLGGLSLNISVGQQTITGFFLTQKKQVNEHLQQMLPELTDILSGLGFDRVAIDSRLAGDVVLQRFKKVLEEKACLKNKKIIDLTA